MSGFGFSFGVNVHVPTNFKSAPSIVFEFASHFVNVHVPLFVVSSYVVCVGSLAFTLAPSAYSASSVGLYPSTSAGRVFPSVPLTNS